MPTEQERRLIDSHITKSNSEIFLQTVVFAVSNILSLGFIALISYKVIYGTYDEKDEYSKYLQASLALLIPFVTFIAQGHIYPRKRRIATLKHIRQKNKLTSDDIKCIYEK